MPRSFNRFAAVVVLAAIVLGTLAPAADANPHHIQFARIQYDSPGADTGTNASLNGEYVVVKNLGTTARNINGYTVRDINSAHVYRFPSTNLAAGKGIRVHSGHGTNTRTDRYWNLDTYVWNNAGDTARLRNAGGTELDACGWHSDAPGYIICPT